MRHALRLWRRQPVLALAAIVSLGLGIGANTAIFSVMNAVVLQPLPFPNADRLVVAWETSTDNPTRWVAPANYLDWVRDTRSFESLAAFDSFSANLTGRGEPERLRAAGASGSFFATLGAHAVAGRTLVPADDAPGAEPVAVLTDGLAARLYGMPEVALGQSLLLEGRPHTVVGVMPPSFVMPMMPAVEIWLSSDRGIPRSFPFPGDITTVRDSHILFVVGRLADGVTAEAAGEELRGVMAQLARTYPDTNEGLGAAVVGLQEQVVGNVRPLVLLLQLAVALMLAIGCANVANLLLGQAASRHAELSTRVALGAGRARLVGQLLAETLVIAVPGGLFGLLIALWGLDALVGLAPDGLPRVGEIGIDASVLAFTALVTVGTAIAFGLGPALSSTRRSITDAARHGVRVSGDRQVQRWHQVMAVGELAVAQVLLVGAGLLLSSLAAAQRVDLGFVPEGRVAADVSLLADRYLRPRTGDQADGFRVDPAPKRAFIDTALERLRTTPGIRAAAASFTAPLAGAPNRGFRIEGVAAQSSAQGPNADFQVVTPDYFRTLGITLVRGRAFTTQDTASALPVAIVNQTFAERFFAGRDPVGQALLFGDDQRHVIVGIAADARYRDIEQPPDATFYVPLAQNDERWPFVALTVWYASGDGETDVPPLETRTDAAAVTAALRAAVRDADPNQPIARIRTYDEIVAAGLASRRFNTLLVGIFAATALALAAVGTFGVMAFSVAARTRELAVRAALGATPADLLRLVLGQGVGVCAAAVLLGLAAAWLATRSMASMLFGVQPADPFTYVAVAVTLSVVALTATWLPARGATRVDPTAALRES